MSIELTRKEFQNLVDMFVNSEIGKRIDSELSQKYTKDENEEYPAAFWDELVARHIQAAQDYIDHSVDVHRLFKDELS